MTSFDELIGTPHVPVVERAFRGSVGWALLEWLRSFGAAGAQVLLTIAVLLGLLATAPVAFGQISTTVMSDSMEPGLHSGDVVILRPVTGNHVKIGQVVLVDDPDTHGRLRLHRLVDVRHGDLVLKGDANASPDSSYVSAHQLHGVGWLRVPWIGLPVLWMRDHTYLPLGLAAITLMLLAWLAAADRQDGGRHRDEPTLDRSVLRRLVQRLSRIARGVRRSKAARSAAVSLVVAALLVVAPLAGPSSAWSIFSGATTSPSNLIKTGTFDCPSRPIPASDTVLYYNYMPATGSTEPDAANGTASGALSGGVTRVAGNCTPNASPYVSLDGSSGVVSQSGKASAPGTFSISMWFMADARSGVLADWGNVPGSSGGSSTVDRSIFFQSNGALAFGVVLNSTPTLCTLPAPTTGAWHLVVATFDSTSKAGTLYLDGSSSPCTFTGSGSGLTSRGYWRFGYDTPSSATWTTASSNGAFGGALDESAVYSIVLTPSQVNSVLAAGR